MLLKTPWIILSSQERAIIHEVSSSLQHPTPNFIPIFSLGKSLNCAVKSHANYCSFTFQLDLDVLIINCH